MRVVSVYVNNRKLDLFNDEEIVITSTIQNVQDISKVFTDFSQTFTVPCSKTNNSIFQHYYNSDVDSTFSAQNRQDSRIEINNTIFRTGQLQLESAEVKGLESDNYKVTFYGDITTLKDLFSNDKLSDLDLGLTVTYDDATVTNAQDDVTDLDVRFPLISSNRLWQYGDASANDISTVGGKIAYTELFPAIKDKVIFNAIATKYGLTFSGLFLNNDRFKRSFTWWKNRKLPEFTLAPEQIMFAVGETAPLNDGIFTLQYIDPTTYAPVGYQSAYTEKQVSFFLTPNITATYYIDVYYKDINILTGIEGSLNQAFTVTVNGVANVQDQTFVITGGGTSGSETSNREYTFFIRSTTALTLQGTLKYFVKGFWTIGGVASNTIITNTTKTLTATTTTNLIDFESSAPDITVAEYFTGKLNQFNLTCFPLGNNLTFQIEPIPTWYKNGRDINITKYIDIESITYERIKLYKNISFEYQVAQSFLNKTFRESFFREYGDLKYEFDYDGGDFKIKLPFENLLFQKFTSTDLQVGFSMTDAIQDADKSYVPKATSLYLDLTPYAVTFKIGTKSATSYLPFGQDATISGQDYTTNFGTEQSTLKDEIIDNSLFDEYYLPYLTGLFNPKARRVKCKGRLPLSLLTDLTLDMKPIIRDKRYLIEEVKSNLTTGEVEFVLINDFMPRPVTVPVRPFTSIANTYKINVVINRNNQNEPTNTATIEAPSEVQFVTSTPVLPTNITTSTSFEIVIPANTSGVERTNTIPVVYKELDGTVIRTEYYEITQEPEITTLTGGGITLLTNTFNELIA